MGESVFDEVRRRAHGVCEYCRIQQDYYPAPFEIDHIVAKQHGGRSAMSNLALAWLHCNAHKGPNIAGLDPLTRKLARLFHPRRQKWERHFRWNGPFVVGRTAVGRVTVSVLAMNDPYLVALRRTLIEEGRFPPST